MDIQKKRQLRVGQIATALKEIGFERFGLHENQMIFEHVKPNVDKLSIDITGIENQALSDWRLTMMHFLCEGVKVMNAAGERVEIKPRRGM